MGTARIISLKFRFFTFACIALLLWSYRYHPEQARLHFLPVAGEPFHLISFTEYLLTEALLHFRIPMLFGIAGYICAMQRQATVTDGISRKVKSLLIPYLVWSAAGLALGLAWHYLPATDTVLAEYQVNPAMRGLVIHETGWMHVLYRWLFDPAAFQVWLLLALFIFNWIQPFIQWSLKSNAAVWFLMVLLLWLFGTNFLVVDARGLFYFSLGIWLYQSNISLEKAPSWYRPAVVWSLFFLISLLKTYMAFQSDLHPALYRLASVLHEAAVLGIIPAIWFGSDTLVRTAMRQHWFVWAASFSFFIFGLHAPLMLYIHQLLEGLFADQPMAEIGNFLLTPVLVLACCLLVGACIRKWLPGVYKLSVGAG
ncbi:MAG TPA: acyltransferase family protein [Sediminibacterium sp.]|nr:acyltransferase family protein [Sediminibacterium sp.]